MYSDSGAGAPSIHCFSGVGSVDYWGQPTVERSTSGLGSITGHGDKR